MLAFVPMVGKFTMAAEEAVEATKAIRPKRVIPIHRLDSDVDVFAKGLAGEAVRCIVPEIGQPIII